MNAVKNMGAALGGFAFVRKALFGAKDADEENDARHAHERLEPCYCDRNVFNVLH
jgi:hypothetical protein